MKILYLEDDLELATTIAHRLRRADLAVDHVGTMADAHLSLSVSRYDLLVFDRTVPDGDSLTLVSTLRADDNAVPILILTARASVTDRVIGFENGADDYLVKPFATAELLARVRALLRRGTPVHAPILLAGDIELDIPRHRVTRGGIQLSLRGKEFAVLEVLMHHVDEVVTRTTLIESCWDEHNDPASNVVDAVMAQLRRRLRGPEVIETVRGVGYRLGAVAL